MQEISKSTKIKVWNKTGGRCWYCGCRLKPWSDVNNTVGEIFTDVFCIDHATPKHKGGNGRIENLLPSCWLCNSGKKKGKTVEEYRQYLGYKSIGAPMFSQEQIAWLSDNGISIPKPPAIFFWGETNE